MTLRVVLIFLLITASPVFAQDEVLSLKDILQSRQLPFLKYRVGDASCLLGSAVTMSQEVSTPSRHSIRYLQSPHRSAKLSYDEGRGRSKEPQQPPLDGWKISGEFLFGSLTGIVGGIVIGGIISKISDSNCYELECLGEAIVNFYIGYIIGSPVGVYLVGTSGNETGSYLATSIGSVLGGVGSVLLFLEHEDGWPMVLVAPPLGGTIGFNMTRRYKVTSALGSGLINFRDGQIRLAVPKPYPWPDAYQRTLIPNVDLLRVRF